MHCSHAHNFIGLLSHCNKCEMPKTKKRRKNSNADTMTTRWVHSKWSTWWMGWQSVRKLIEDERFCASFVQEDDFMWRCINECTFHHLSYLFNCDLHHACHDRTNYYRFFLWFHRPIFTAVNSSVFNLNGSRWNNAEFHYSMEKKKNADRTCGQSRSSDTNFACNCRTIETNWII